MCWANAAEATFALTLGLSMLCCGPGLAHVRMSDYRFHAQPVPYYAVFIIYLVLVVSTVVSSTWWFNNATEYGVKDCYYLASFVVFSVFAFSITAWKGCMLHISSYRPMATINVVLSVIALLSSIAIFIIVAFSGHTRQFPPVPIVAWAIACVLTLVFVIMSIEELRKDVGPSRTIDNCSPYVVASAQYARVNVSCDQTREW